MDCLLEVGAAITMFVVKLLTAKPSIADRPKLGCLLLMAASAVSVVAK